LLDRVADRLLSTIDQPGHNGSSAVHSVFGGLQQIAEQPVRCGAA
jgi:hypothetical protein